MKKILLFTLLASSLFAEAQIYVGTSYGLYNESVSNNAAQSSLSSNMATLKVGYGNREAYAIEFSVDYIDNSDKLFDIADSNYKTDGAKYGLNVDLLKAFNWGIYVLPYAKVGFGAGEMKSDLNNGSLKYGSFNLGFGMFIPINEHFDAELGYDYRYLSYEKPNDSDADITRSHVNVAYLGVNLRF